MTQYNENITKYVFSNAPQGCDVLKLAFTFAFPHVDSVEANIPLGIRRMLCCQWCKGHPSSAERITTTGVSHGYYCCTTLYCFNCHLEWYVCASCSYTDMLPLHHGKGGKSRTSCYVRKQRFLEHVDIHRKRAQEALVLIQNHDVDPRCDDQIDSMHPDSVYDVDFNTGEDVITYDNANHVSGSDSLSNHANSQTDNVNSLLFHSEYSIDRSVHNLRTIFDNTETKHLADFIMHELRGNASNHVIHNTILGSSIGSTAKKISADDSLLFTILLSLGSKMSRDERNQLALLIQLIRCKVLKENMSECEDSSNNHVQLPLPITSYAMRKIFEPGKHQFTQYMPLPPVLSPIPGYASVPLLQTLQLLYSRGMKFDNYDNHPRVAGDLLYHERSITSGELFQSRVHDMSITAQHDDIVLQPIVLWSDSADLNKVKNNRSSLMKVHNIYIPHIHGQSVDCVFPLAVGSGKSEHDVFRNNMFKEITEMHGGSIYCYDRDTNCNRKVQFYLLAIVQDRPEHSEFTGTIGHNGTYGMLPGISFPRSILRTSYPGIQTLKDLASCPTCFIRRVRKICRMTSSHDNDTSADGSSTDCNDCYDWDVSKIRFFRPSKMPMDIPLHCFVSSDTAQPMLAQEVTFESIMRALQYIHVKAYKKDWTDFSKTAQQYASLQCVSIGVAKRVYMAAKALRVLHVKENRYNASVIPELDVQEIPRSITSGQLLLEQCMVGIMHTLFLNGGKKILILIHDIFKKEKSSTFFLTKSKIFFRNLRSLSLNWVMAWPFGSTADKPLAPWVSENYVAFHHVSKSYVSIICAPLLSKGKVAVVNALKLLISIWHRVISIIMQPTIPTADEILQVTELAKLFLSKYHEMEVYLGRKSTEWDLQNASCHMMLLKIPTYMTKFGCLRNFWEGGHMGERSVTTLKKNIPHGAHMDGSLRSAIRRYFIDVVLSQLLKKEHGNDNVKAILDDETSEHYNPISEDGVVNNNENNTKIGYDRYRRFHCYKSREAVIEAVIEQKPVSMLHNGIDKYFAVIVWGDHYNNRERLLYKVDLGCDLLMIEGMSMIRGRSIIASLTDDDDNEEHCHPPVPLKHVMLDGVTSCIALWYNHCCSVAMDEGNGDSYYYVRTEHHREVVRHSVLMGGNETACGYTFEYPALFKRM